MPAVWRALWTYTQGRIDYVGTAATAAVGLGLVAYMVRTCRWYPAYLLLPPVVGAYVWLLGNLGQSPAERLHLAEYGFLSLFTYRALRIDTPGVAAYFGGWAIASALGGVDEAIQWVLPERVFEWKDVGLNVVSSGLGMLVVAIVKRGARGIR